MKLAGPYAEFGIIDDYDPNCDYSRYEPKKYQCVAVPDDLINLWWDSLLHMPSHPLDYPIHKAALDRWGVTIIPPESLRLFIDIISTETPRDYAQYTVKLLALLERAVSEQKNVIHFGV